MPPSEVLDRAADLITTAGHLQRSYWPGVGSRDYEPGDPVCAIGAVCVVRGATTDEAVLDLLAGDDPALVALAETLDFPDTSWIGGWNDRWRCWPWLARRRVLEAMRRAARVCR